LGLSSSPGLKGFYRVLGFLKIREMKRDAVQKDIERFANALNNLITAIKEKTDKVFIPIIEWLTKKLS
jgi:hypothetical protein